MLRNKDFIAEGESVGVWSKKVQGYQYSGKGHENCEGEGKFTA